MATEILVALDRFWTPSGRTCTLSSQGWLVDPSATGWFQQNADLVRTSRLLDHQCLVLLGEPGMGKSSTMAVSGPLRETSDPTVSDLSLDLGSYSSEELIARKVFEHPEVLSWHEGDRTLCLTLDGFDEARLRVETLPRLLLRYLDDWDCSRLLLRIVCRTADWPTSLTGALERKFGDVGAYELVPMRRVDAFELLAGVEGDAWPVSRIERALVAIENANLVPLAARPLTLELLRAAFGADGVFPESAADLYARGLLALADETTDERRDAWPLRVPARLRVDVAERLAAFSTFGDYPTIWTGQPRATAPTNNDVRELEEDRLAGSGKHDAEAIRQTLRSGLFAGAGENRVRWAHATFSDYLAARWILDKLTDGQVRSVVISSDGRVHTRLRSVASWLIRAAPDRFGWMIPTDPEAFLANVDIPDVTLRRQLVEAVLSAARAGELFSDFEWNLRGLWHLELVDQLRPALTSTSENVVRIATSITRQCNALELIPDLVAIALDEDIEVHLRVSAAMAVYDLSAEHPTSGLRTLLSSASQQADVKDRQTSELEGAALLASWPHAISTAEVFAILNPRHARNFTGIYSIFISDFAQALGPGDLESACAWLREDLSRIDDSRLAPLVVGISKLCVQCLDDEEAQTTLRTISKLRARESEPLFGENVFDDEMELGTSDRRRVAEVLLVGANDDEIINLVGGWSNRSRGLLRASDFEWLLALYARTPGQDRDPIAAALRFLRTEDDPFHANAILSLQEDHPAARLFTPWRGVVMIDSVEAQQARDDWERLFRRKRERHESQQQDEPTDAWVNPRIVEAAAEAARGSTTAFWEAVRLVTVRPGTVSLRGESEPDLRAHPRWSTLPAAARQNLIEAAPFFLNAAKCEPEEWLGNDSMSWIAYAAYRAMVLLQLEDPSSLSLLKDSAWREWAPILVDFPTLSDASRRDHKTQLLNLAVPHARHELETALLTVVDSSIAKGTHTFHQTELAVLMSPRLASELISRLEGPMAAQTRDDLLNALTPSHWDQLHPILIGWLGEDERATDPERATTAVLRILQGPTPDAWPALRNLMDANPEFVAAAMTTNGFAYDRSVPNLPEDELSFLYIWVCRRFPHDEDPHYEDAHIVGPREALGQWRDQVLWSLRDRGTPAAVAAVKRIQDTFPELTWLAYTYQEAGRAARTSEWQPLTPLQLDDLASRPERRLVRTDAELADATLHALAEVQSRLQGDTPTAHHLWDTYSGRPKGEEELSDFLFHELRRELHDSGVVVNREVQVRRTRVRGGIPERTDLRIEAIPYPRAQAISNAPAWPTTDLLIPGEVKGCWNREVVSAVGDQLVDRYMADFHTATGVFIVGWFDQESWTDEDKRRRDAHRWNSRDDLELALQEERIRQSERGFDIRIVVLDCSLRRPDSASRLHRSVF